MYIHLLGILSQRDCSLGELAEVVSVSPPTMSNTVSTLESRDWVRRRRSEQDRRVVLVSLTPEGRSVLGRAQDYMVQRIADALAPLDHGELERLAAGLEILRDVFSHVPSSAQPAETP